MDFKTPKHNTPSATLIKNYLNKKSGKVVESRREIQRRFNGMDWCYQKRILVAFINGIASDREWACRKMFAYWDDSFIPIVAALWGQYHENSLSWLILRYFPKEFLKTYIDQLSGGRNYYYLCQRLIDETDFNIDRDRLYESDIIKLYSITKRSISDEEIKETFFSLIVKVCKVEYRSRYMYQWDVDHGGIEDMSIMNNRIVWSTLHEIEYVLNRNSLAEKIRSWNNMVMQAVKECNEFRLVKQMSLKGGHWKEVLFDLIRKYCLKYLDQFDVPHEEQAHVIVETRIDPKRQHASLSELRKKSPALNKLLGNFDLEMDGGTELPELPF